MTKENKYLVFTVLMLSGLILSGIAPHDYFTWILEVFPAVIALIILTLTRKTFPFALPSARCTSSSKPSWQL